MAGASVLSVAAAVYGVASGCVRLYTVYLGVYRGCTQGYTEGVPGAGCGVDGVLSLAMR